MKKTIKKAAGKKEQNELTLLREEVLKTLCGHLTRMFFNKEQAADFTTLSWETLDKAIDRGDLKHHNYGSRIFFTRGELIDFMMKCPPRPRKRKEIMA